MKEIEFLEFEYENYCQFEEKSIYKFENGITIIAGPNGAGKTNMMDVPGFTLFGITSKGNRGPDVVNSRAGKNCMTGLKLNVNKEFMNVIRYYQHSKFGNGVHILDKDGKPIESKNKDSAKLIEQLILPGKLFFNIISFGQKVKNFFTTLGQAEQRDIFRKIFLLDVYELWYKQTDMDIKEVSKELDSIVNTIELENKLLERENTLLLEIEEEKKKFYEEKSKVLENYEYQMNMLMELMNDTSLLLSWYLEQNIDSLLLGINSEISSLQRELEILTDSKKQKLDKLLAEDDSKRRDVDSQVQNKNLQIDMKKESLVNNVKQKYSSSKSELAEKKATLNGNITTLRSQIDSANINKQMLTEECKSYQENVIDKDISQCPTCGQEITGDTINKLKKMLLVKQQQVLKIQDENEKREIDINELSKQISDISYKISFSLQKEKEEISDIERRANVAKEKILEEKKTRISEFEKIFKANAQTVVDEICKKQEEVKKKLEKLEIEKQLYSDLSNKQRKEIESFERSESKLVLLRQSYETKDKETFNEERVSNIKESISKYKANIKSNKKLKGDTEAKLKRLALVKEAYSPSGIPNYLINTGIPFMNEECAKFLDMVSEGRYSVTFDTLSQTKAGEFRDKVSINPTDTQNLTNSRKQLSGGQERLIDIYLMKFSIV